MLFWIYVGIVVYLATVWLPSLFLVGQIGVMGYSKGRDEEPVSSCRLADIADDLGLDIAYLA